MTETHHHLIHKKVIDVTVDNQDDADKILDHYGILWADRLKDIEDRVLSSFSDGVIELLEVDMGEISFDMDEYDFAIVYEEAIHKSLAEVFSQPTDINMQVHNSATQLKNVIPPVLYFLEHGHLPWWAEYQNDNTLINKSNIASYNIDLTQQLKSLQSKNPAIIQNWFDGVSTNIYQVIATRCFNQFGIEMLKSLTKVVFSKHENILNNIVEITSIINSINKNKYSIINIEKTLILSLWYLSKDKVKNTKIVIDDIIKDYINKHIDLDIKPAIRASIDSNEYSKQQIELIKKLDYYSNDLFTEEKLEKTTVKNQETIIRIDNNKNEGFSIIEPNLNIDSINVEQQRANNKTIPREESFSITSFADAKELFENTPPNNYDKKANIASIKTKEEEQIKKRNIEIAEILQKDTQNISYLGKSIFIRNSGLILLHPFMNDFFKTLGYRDENDWISPDSAKQAALSLQFLVTGQQDFPEYDLVLNKILCGLPLDTVLPRSIEITVKMKKESEALLTAVIQHWSMLKNTSINGLRSTFLFRQGLLQKQDKNWNLRIEKGSYDMLLDGLPWGYHIVRFSWMREILEVEW